MMASIRRPMIVFCALAVTVLVAARGLAQDGQNKLGAEPIGSKEDAEKARRQQQELDNARNKDIYNKQQRDADLAMQRLKEQKRQQDLKDKQKQAEFEQRAKRKAAEEDARLKAARNTAERDQAARDKRAAELRQQRQIDQAKKQDIYGGTALPADEAQRRTRDIQRRNDEAAAKLAEQKKKEDEERRAKLARENQPKKPPQN